MTSSWFFLSTLNYDARSTTHQINLLQSVLLSELVTSLTVRISSFPISGDLMLHASPSLLHMSVIRQAATVYSRHSTETLSITPNRISNVTHKQSSTVIRCVMPSVGVMLNNPDCNLVSMAAKQNSMCRHKRTKLHRNHGNGCVTPRTNQPYCNYGNHNHVNR